MTETKTDQSIFVGLEAWQTILEKCGAVEVYNKVKDIAGLAPPKELIFECFRYFKPNDMKILLLAQDPYPTAGDACGLCFCTNGTCPKSLKAIYDNLVQNKLCESDVKRNGNLKSWAAQGVLLLNTALTTTVGNSNVHSDIWSKFTTTLMEQLNEFKQPLHVFMWGGFAKSYAGYFTKEYHVLHKWSHPSPMSDNALPEPKKFKNHDHFRSTSDLINWNPEQNIMVWTDGACSGNGKSSAVAGFGSLILGGYMGKTVVSGKVRGCKYILNDDHTIGYDEKSPETPTNNRGELLGILYGLWVLDRSYISGSIEIIVDSEYALNTLEDYYPKRLGKGTQSELVNLDLLEICYKLVKKIRQHSKVIFTHTRSHKSLPTDADDRAKCIHAGNETVDSAAVSAKDYTNFDIIINTKLPALLKYKK